MTASDIFVINTNPKASTRNGTRALVRSVQRLVPATVQVVERHFQRLSVTDVQAKPPLAVILGPQGVPFQSYEPTALQELYRLIRTLRCPLLGVCGGHQALALAYDGQIAPIHGEKLPTSGRYGNLKKMTGLQTMIRQGHAPETMLDSIQSPMTFFSSHVEAISKLPNGFSSVLVGPHDTIQMVRRDEYPQYGVQFHPERGGDGRQLLRNFLALAGVDSQ